MNDGIMTQSDRQRAVRCATALSPVLDGLRRDFGALDKEIDTGAVSLLTQIHANMASPTYVAPLTADDLIDVCFALGNLDGSAIERDLKSSLFGFETAAKAAVRILKRWVNEDDLLPDSLENEDQ